MSSPGTESRPPEMTRAGVWKLSLEGGEMQVSSIRPNGSTPSTGDSRNMPCTELQSWNMAALFYI